MEYLENLWQQTLILAKYGMFYLFIWQSLVFFIVLFNSAVLVFHNVVSTIVMAGLDFYTLSHPGRPISEFLHRLSEEAVTGSACVPSNYFHALIRSHLQLSPNRNPYSLILPQDLPPPLPYSTSLLPDFSPFVYSL